MFSHDQDLNAVTFAVLALLQAVFFIGFIWPHNSGSKLQFI